MDGAMLRLKMTVNSVKKCTDGNGTIISEEIHLSAVYGPEGSLNAQWSKWTPSALLTMQISNPAAFDKIRPGHFMFVDLTRCEKDSCS